VNPFSHADLIAGLAFAICGLIFAFDPKKKGRHHRWIGFSLAAIGVLLAFGELIRLLK